MDMNIGHKFFQQLIEDVLDQHTRQRKLGIKVFQAFMHSITSALQRGESVHVKGFGIFKIVDKPAKRTGHNVIINMNRGRKQIFADVPMTSQQRKRVRFYPSKQLMAMLNKDATMNVDERRAAATW